MSFLETVQGRQLLDRYLKKYKGGSQRVYRSEIQQFFEFKDIALDRVDGTQLHHYRDKLSGEHSPATAKRKFSILNGFFKFLQSQVKGFVNPIQNLGDFKTHRGTKSAELQKYLAAFLAEQNTSNTRRSYDNQVRLFFTWAGKDLAEIERADIMSYRDFLKTEKGHKDTTIWNKFIALNRFFKFMERENRKFKNPIIFRELKLIFPKRDKGYYSVLSSRESEEVDAKLIEIARARREGTTTVTLHGINDEAIVTFREGFSVSPDVEEIAVPLGPLFDRFFKKDIVYKVTADFKKFMESSHALGLENAEEAKKAIRDYVAVKETKPNVKIQQRKE
ncbi:MAG: hypothetical protein F9K32_13065 [Desulfobulbaceae bacterium]|nr:MAG: hypothetical protein F9K32_13065 [Desulfobulbaceae bacterium]